MDNIITIGTPPAITIDTVSGQTSLFLSATDIDIMDLWRKQFAQISDVNVCLSGGMDSQFSFFLAKELANRVTATTFVFLWDNNVINSTDITTVERLEKQENIAVEYVEIDLKRILDIELHKWTLPYKNSSPQLAAHMAAISTMKPDQYIMLGGEVPLLNVIDGKVSLTDPNNSEMSMYDSELYKKYLVPYYATASDYGLTINKNPFLMSPEIHYQSLKKNHNVFTEHNIYYEISDSTSLRHNAYKVKQAYYKTYGFDYILPLAKRTGFESLRTHLATETGVYNEFDIRYRQPYIKQGEREKWYQAVSKNRVVTVDGPTESLLAELQQSFDNSSAKPGNIYNFDW